VKRFLRRAQMLDQIRDRANSPRAGKPTTHAERDFERARRVEQEAMRRVLELLRGGRSLH
jgi:hypothetical protein